MIRHVILNEEAPNLFLATLSTIMASKHFRVSEIVSELISPLRALKYIRVYAFEAITSCQTHDVIRDGLPLARLNVRACSLCVKNRL